MVLMKHKVNSPREFGVVCLINIININLKVLQVILSGLFSIKLNLYIARLILTSAIY